ncbi:MAG: site-specific DNA-methyltransferase [Roseivirga sp.]|nr:site-specific DNA-methyltransferase [Roseivirga sp.]
MILPLNQILFGDVIEQLKRLPDKCVDICVTSPPYWGLRDYGVSGQLGLEETPDEFIANMVKVFNEIYRVLKDDGTLWVNIGDSYATGGRRFSNNIGGFSKDMGWRSAPPGLKHKDLVGIPWMLAFALRADGWYLRQDIIWHKPNPMPESVKDRCTKSHEYVFLLSKSPKYYYDSDAIKTPAKDPADDLRRKNSQTWDMKNTPDKLRNGLRPVKSGNKERKSGAERGCPENGRGNVSGSVPWEGKLANRRSVWPIHVKPFKEAHFATFPEELPMYCIKAGSKEGGIVLDPFFGSGTTGVVARKLNRNFIGIELNPEYIKIAERRIYKELGMFA